MPILWLWMQWLYFHHISVIQRAECRFMLNSIPTKNKKLHRNEWITANFSNFTESVCWVHPFIMRAHSFASFRLGFWTIERFDSMKLLFTLNMSIEPICHVTIYILLSILKLFCFEFTLRFHKSVGRKNDFEMAKNKLTNRTKYIFMYILIGFSTRGIVEKPIPRIFAFFADISQIREYIWKPIHSWNVCESTRLPSNCFLPNILWICE